MPAFLSVFQCSRLHQRKKIAGAATVDLSTPLNDAGGPRNVVASFAYNF